MLEITLDDDCYKCDLETINDPNNCQVIFDKCKDLSTQKYRNELTPNITFQPNKLFVRNDLFETVIKSCKETNLELLKLKGKLGLCLYKDICDKKRFILMSEESFIQHDVENKQLKEENKQLNENENEKENENENEKFRKNKIVKDSNIQELIEEPKSKKS